MVYAGHTDPNTQAMHYHPRNCADGQAAYHGQKRRTHVLNLFRGLTIPRNPSLLQCLPAKKRFEFENKPELISLNQELAMLRGTTNGKELLDRKKKYAEKRKLLNKEVRDWQKNQPIKRDDPSGYHRAIFDRVRFMMPERNRLAQNLFEIAIMRSQVGLAVLRDMISLYQKDNMVEYRPGLEPEKCCCEEGRKNVSYNWRHIYSCYKASLEHDYEFAELCFLCNNWFFGTQAWEAHCQQHLAEPDSLPIWCDPLTHGGVLARAGYCPFCLGDENLSAPVRMFQFKIRRNWQCHIQGHIEKLEDNSTSSQHCPRQHPHCPGMFDSVLELQFHLQDSFGIERIGEVEKKKRPRHEDDDYSISRRKRQRRGYDFIDDDELACKKMQYIFTTSTMDNKLECQMPSESPNLSRHSTSSWTATNTSVADETCSGYSTPLSSVDFEVSPGIFPDSNDIASTTTNTNISPESTCGALDAGRSMLLA